MNVLRQHGHAAWVVPTYKNGRALWRWVQQVAGPLAADKKLDISKTERAVTTPRGGFFAIYSGDNADAIRSESFDLVVEDEAARIKEDAHTDAILPTLADRDGDLVIITTPNRRNWVFAEFKRAQADGVQAIAYNAPSSDNPNPNIKRAFALAKERVGSRTFAQEWLAQFLEDGNYFTNVDKCATIQAPDDPEAHKGHSVVMGIDWGKSHDFTVLTCICRECSKVVDWERFGQMDYTVQRERVRRMHQKWGCYSILPERNSIGEPNIEILRSWDLPIAVGSDLKHGFHTSASNKAVIIDALQAALDQVQLLVPLDYADELAAYEVKTRDISAPLFSAPSGMFDDRVMSLALAWHQATQTIQFWV